MHFDIQAVQQHSCATFVHYIYKTKSKGAAHRDILTLNMISINTFYYDKYIHQVIHPPGFFF